MLRWLSIIFSGIYQHPASFFGFNASLLLCVCVHISFWKQSFATIISGMSKSVYPSGTNTTQQRQWALWFVCICIQKKNCTYFIQWSRALFKSKQKSRLCTFTSINSFSSSIWMWHTVKISRMKTIAVNGMPHMLFLIE